MLPITLKLKHNITSKNYNLEIISFPELPAVIEYTKVYKENKLTIIHVTDNSKKGSIEKCVYICRDISTDIFNAEKIFTRTFDEDDCYLIHKVSKDLKTIAITVKAKSTFNNINNNKISLFKFQNDIWVYSNDVIIPKQLKYKNRYRLSHIMSFDHKGDHLAVLLSPKDKTMISSRKRCGIVFQRKDSRYFYKGYFKYRSNNLKQNKILLDIRSNKNTQNLLIKLIDNKEYICNLITEQ